MKIHHYALFLFTAIATLTVPATSFAFTTIDQKAIKIGDHAVAYFVTYQFGMKNYEIEMPIAAVRAGVESGEKKLAYQILDNSRYATDLGEVISVVVSDAAIKDNKYVIPKGEARKFTLLTLLTLPKGGVPESLDLSLKVTDLPFIMNVDGGVKVEGQLNPSELTDYITPEVKFAKTSTATVPAASK